MSDSAFYVREQLTHRETPVLPRSLPIEEPLAVLLDERKGGRGWRGKLPHYMACPVSFDNWGTMIKQPDGTFIDAYQVQWEWTDDIARVIKPPLSVIPAEKYTFPDFSLFWNDEKARNVEKAVEANRG
ncbi:MAG: hypothetical protein LBG57_08670, partial [Treponema sp.]|nr:hypothetical protein [Treponema sp.]